MRRILTVVLVLVSGFFIWESGAINLALAQRHVAALMDPGPVIGRSADAMRNLQSLHLTMRGTVVSGGIDGVQLSGTGELSYPHKEAVALQLLIPSKLEGDPEAIAAENIRIENGRQYVQIPAQGGAWKDVTSDEKSQLAPGMDPINNLDLAHAFRVSEDLGETTMEGVTLHHFSLRGDPQKYIDDLSSDPLSGLTPEQQALLSGAGIKVEIWIAPGDDYVHQMKVEISTTEFSWSITYQFSRFVKGRGTTGA